MLTTEEFCPAHGDPGKFPPEPGDGDDFVQDRHADLDAGENGGAMTDADYYDRISGEDVTFPADPTPTTPLSDWDW